MPAIAISSGHSLKVRGAKGVLDEVDENRKVVDRVTELLQSAGVAVRKFHDNTSSSVSTNLSAIVNFHNSASRDIDCSVHFNAFQSTSRPMGCETLYVTQQTLAKKITDAIVKAGGFVNRGAKKRSDLAFLNRTTKPAVLLEVCFVDSTADAALYRKSFDDVCHAIAETLGELKIPGGPPEEILPPEPEPGPSGENIVEIAIEVKGEALVTLNGEPVNESESLNRVALTMAHEGDVIITVNGEDFQIERPAVWQTDIIGTVFGGNADPNNSAYPPFDKITDTELSVALPWKFVGSRQKVRVFNRATGKEVLCQIRDVGPWLIDDNYWDTEIRPLAETCFNTKTPLPRGPHKGKVPNGAAIDLTPAAARAIGLDGKAVVDWTFVTEDEGASS